MSQRRRTVVFQNGRGGSATMGTGGTRAMDNPLQRSTNVPEPGTTALLAVALAGLALARRANVASA